ncbi:MAG: hypothetical protein M1814_004055 [Vezdaea aestivalis]|nr:MAG: hypothetical protein M1814_004055 [Vezdaea aestivalis]
MASSNKSGGPTTRQHPVEYTPPNVAVDPKSRTSTTMDEAPPSSYTLNASSNSTAESVPTSLGRGSTSGEGDRPEVPDADLDGEQMRAPGDGEIYAAQFNKTGTADGPEIGGDLDKKKAEQQEARENVASDRKKGIDVGI